MSSRSIDSFFRPAPPVPTSSASSAAPAYPECNKTGVWESVKYTPQMKDIRRNEIRKLQREFAKRVASASGQRKKKSKKLKWEQIES